MLARRQRGWILNRMFKSLFFFSDQKCLGFPPSLKAQLLGVPIHSQPFFFEFVGVAEICDEPTLNQLTCGTMNAPGNLALGLGYLVPRVDLQARMG